MINGWIYCISNSYFKLYNIYKIDTTISRIFSRKPNECIKNYIINNNKLYFNNIELIEFIPVNNITDAQDHLYCLISNYHIGNKFYKTDFDKNLKPSFDYIKKIYMPNYILKDEPLNKISKNI